MGSPKLYHLALTKNELEALEWVLGYALTANAQSDPSESEWTLTLSQMKLQLGINWGCHLSNPANSVLVEVRRKLVGRR